MNYLKPGQIVRYLDGQTGSISRTYNRGQLGTLISRTGAEFTVPASDCWTWEFEHWMDQLLIAGRLQ